MTHSNNLVKDYFMKHSDGCIICGNPRPSTINAALYCTRCRSIVAKIQTAAGVAMATQDIPPPTGSCADCGKPATCYDHRYYSLPLEVDPVCVRCNINRGPALDVVDIARGILGLVDSDTAPTLNLPEKLDLAEKRTIQ